MILVVDSSALTLLVNPASNPPIDPSTGQLVARSEDRVRHLISSLSAASDTLIIPTPVMAEVLVEAGDAGPAILEQIGTFARVRIESFDLRAAIETALMTREAIDAGNKKGGADANRPWQWVKYDRQIVAIGRVHRATHVYSDDGSLANFARSLGMTVISTWELPLPETRDNLFTLAGLTPDGIEPESAPPTGTA